MKKYIYFVSIAVSAFLFASCEDSIDNYDAPDGGIKGTIYDVSTNEPIPLPVQGSGGVLVNLYEQNTTATKSIDFRAKQDGSYENARIFNREYKVVVNGPFVEPCEGVVTVNGQTQFDLKATPYSRISIQASIDANNKLSVSYAVIPTASSYSVKEVSILWNFAPGVDVNSSNYATKGTSDTASGSWLFDLPKDKNYTDNHYKIAANGNKVYVRVAANVAGVTNYSKVVELQVK